MGLAMENNEVVEVIEDDDEYNFKEEDYAKLNMSDFEEQYGMPIVHRHQNRFSSLFLYALFYPEYEWSKENMRSPTLDKTFAYYINDWARRYDRDELEILGSTVWQYKGYITKHSEPKQYTREAKLKVLKAIKMIISIQSGMDRFEAFCDANKELELVKKYQEGLDKQNSRRKLMQMTTAMCNSTVFLTFAKAMDAPIQIHYQGYKHQMIEVLRDIATHGKSEREKVNAADKLLTYLNPNQLTSLNMVNINLGDNVAKDKNVIDIYREGLEMLAREKLGIINKGADTKEIINATILSENKE